MVNIVVGLFCFLAVFGAALAQDPTSEKLEVAKREGAVLWYTGINLADARTLTDLFQRRYPFLKVQTHRASGTQIVNKILVEKNAGKPQFDIASSGVLRVLKQQGVLQPYSSPESTGFSLQYRDPQGYWYGFYAQYFVVAYNVRMLSNSEIPRDWKDLLHPRWKDRIVMEPEDHEWYGGMLEASKDIGSDFLKGLAGQNIQWRRNHALIGQLIAAGEFPLGITYAHRIEALKKTGAPVEWVKTLRPIIAVVAPLGLSAEAKHPVSARLFLDFLISKPVQESMAKMGRTPVRMDVDPFPDYPGMRFTTHVVSESVFLRLEEHAKEFRNTFGIK
jgi:iron(III) transport system substrate-binding protein